MTTYSSSVSLTSGKERVALRAYIADHESSTSTQRTSTITLSPNLPEQTSSITTAAVTSNTRFQRPFELHGLHVSTIMPFTGKPEECTTTKVRGCLHNVKLFAIPHAMNDEQRSSSSRFAVAGP